MRCSGDRFRRRFRGDRSPRPIERTKPFVCSVILNWNNYSDTAECIESLQGLEYESNRIIVVDNGSTDGSGKRINTEYEVDVVFTDRNLGFGGGMNVGVNHAQQYDPKYLWLLNNDVRITDADSLNELVHEAEATESLGIITPVINHSNHYKSWFDRLVINRLRDEQWFERGIVDLKSGTVKHRSCPPNAPQRVENGYIPLCAALIPTRVFDQIGRLREDFFLYYEDVDFCLRLREQGLKLVTLRNVSVIHEGSNSSEGSFGPTSTYYRTRNHILLMDQYRDQAGNMSVSFFKRLVRDVGIRAMLFRFDSCLAMLKGLRDGILKRYGPGDYP